MDDADPKLEGRPESFRDYLRRSHADRLIKDRLWKPWKNEEHFSTVPTAPTTTEKMKKEDKTKNKKKSFTQNL
jgi:hypothetical protein